MDYEKKYKEALERAKEYLKEYYFEETVKEIFPELKESEDEKIRKVITLCLEECVHSDIIRDYEKDKALAWLEKQGEQKPAWTKEDDVRLQACIDTLQAESLMGKVDTVMTNWLKSLKTKVQPKQEWSEEEQRL